MIISIGCDHAGLALKEVIINEFGEVEFRDRGCYAHEVVDYPDIAKIVAFDIRDGVVNYGILICGTGIGMSIAANRLLTSRAALCYNAETARLSRAHNNANILCLGARVISFVDAVMICKQFLSTSFAGGRHDARVKKLGDPI